MTNTDLTLVYLDDYHAGDALFVQSLGRSLARMRRRQVVMVHGSGEHAQRALEAEGIFRERENGLLPVETPEEHALVERALRYANRRITGVFTDAVVPAVGIIGTERGLFRIRDGVIRVENVGWIEALARQGVVPVVAAFAEDVSSGRTGEVPVYRAIEALAAAFESTARAVVFTKTNLPGIMKGSTPEAVATADSLDDAIVEDTDAVSYLASIHLPILLTNTTRLSDEGGPIGTRIQISA